MEKLKQKLSSRKLWAAMLAAIGAIAVALVGEELTPEVVTAAKCAVTALIAYIFGEGAVDVARLIADAVKSAYEIPDLSELVGETEPEEEKDAEGQEDA